MPSTCICCWGCTAGFAFLSALLLGALCALLSGLLGHLVGEVSRRNITLQEVFRVWWPSCQWILCWTGAPACQGILGICVIRVPTEPAELALPGTERHDCCRV